MLKSLKASPAEILEGPILKILIKLSVPSIIAFTFHTVFNFADRFFVSRLGDLELGALGMAFTVQSILLAIGSGVGIGASSLIARFIGAKKMNEADNAAEHSLLIILGFSALITGIGPLITKPLFLLLGASEQMLPYILSYINIILYGSFFQFFAMIGNGILRGEGNMVKPMQVMVIGNIVNIILDPILIFGLGPLPALGIQGAAIATVIGRATSCLLLSLSLFGKKNIIKIRLRSFRFAPAIIRGIFGVGGPTIISQLSNSLGLSMLFILLRPYGDAAKTAFTMGFTYQQVAFLPLIGIAQGTLTMTGQNFGAKNFSRIRSIIKRALIFSACLMAVFTLVFVFGRTALVRIFSRNETIIQIGNQMLLIFSLGFSFIAGRIILTSFFQGLGMGMKALFLNLANMLLFTIPLALLLSVLIGLNGIWTGMVIANALCTLLGSLWAARTSRQLDSRSDC